MSCRTQWSVFCTYCTLWDCRKLLSCPTRHWWALGVFQHRILSIPRTTGAELVEAHSKSLEAKEKARSCSHGSSGLADGSSALFQASPAEQRSSLVSGCALRCLHLNTVSMSLYWDFTSLLLHRDRMSYLQIPSKLWDTFPALFSKDLSYLQIGLSITLLRSLLLWWWCNLSGLIVGENSYCQCINGA